MNKLQLQGSKSVLTNSPLTKTLTNTIIDAVDSVKTSTDIYVHAFSSTVQQFIARATLRSVATDITLAGDSKYAFGVFLSNSLLTNQIFNFKATLSLLSNTANTGIIVTPFFGRCDEATVTASDAAPANLLSDVIFLSSFSDRAHQQNSTIAGYHHVINVDQDIIVDNTTSNNTDPVCAGFILTNTTAATAVSIGDLVSTIQLRSNHQTLDCFRPSGV